MEHAFYAAMGGFVFEIDHSIKPFIRNKPTPFRVTLTSHGVLLLAKCGHLPNISKAFIADKSKADSLAKTLVCVQAAWCLLQYMGRLASHLPVTLLEVNTLGHALCALGIYMSWWYKPLDVRDPYVLSGEWVSRLCNAGEGSLDHSNCVFMDSCYLSQEWRIRASANDGDNQSVRLSEGDTLPGTCFKLNGGLFLPRERKQRVWTSPFHYHIERSLQPVSRTLLLHPEDVRRWRLASVAITQYSDGLTESK